MENKQDASEINMLYANNVGNVRIRRHAIGYQGHQCEQGGKWRATVSDK
jgi:hypothetical protein